MIGERLKKIRNDNDLSMEKFALSLSISKANISNYEKEVYLPNIDTLIKIANTYNISMDWLILGKENNTNLPSDINNLISSFNQLSEREKGYIEGQIKQLLNNKITTNNINIMGKLSV